MMRRSVRILKITRENAEFQVLNALKTNRSKRNKNGFLFEGVRNINNALKYEWPITSFIYSSEKGVSDWARDVLSRSTAEKHYDLSLDLLTKLSDKDETSELLAVSDIPEDDIERITLGNDLLAVVFDRPANPGNLGTLIRSCDALGVAGLVVTGHAVDVYDPETISATTGSLFSLPVVRLPAQADVVEWIEDAKRRYPDLQVVGSDERASESAYDFDFTRPTILLAGNEKAGLSAGYREIADAIVKIPIQGSASSLNVAVATSIVIAEIRRQRR